MLTPREKSPLEEKFSSEEDQTHDAVSSRTASPTHYKAILALIGVCKEKQCPASPLAWQYQEIIQADLSLIYTHNVACLLSKQPGNKPIYQVRQTIPDSKQSLH